MICLATLQVWPSPLPPTNTVSTSGSGCRAAGDHKQAVPRSDPVVDHWRAHDAQADKAQALWRGAHEMWLGFE